MKFVLIKKKKKACTRTERCPIRSIILTGDKQNWFCAGALIQFVFMNKLDDTKSCYLFILKNTISENDTKNKHSHCIL